MLIHCKRLGSWKKGQAERRTGVCKNDDTQDQYNVTQHFFTVTKRDYYCYHTLNFMINSLLFYSLFCFAFMNNESILGTHANLNKSFSFETFAYRQNLSKYAPRSKIRRKLIKGGFEKKQTTPTQRENSQLFCPFENVLWPFLDPRSLSFFTLKQINPSVI